MRVYGGAVAGDDRSLIRGERIKLKRGAGPDIIGRDGIRKRNDDLAHFSMSTFDKIVPFSLLDENERVSLVFGHESSGSACNKVKKLK